MRCAITGGIGSGKSFVCQRLAARGIQVYDCDQAAKRLMRTSAELKQALTRLVGPQAYTDGVLNKAALASFLLSSPQNKEAVNQVVHPAVAADYLASGIEWLESAILFESCFDQRVKFDAVVCVTAPEHLRVERVMTRDHISQDKATEWVRCQMPQEEMRRRSNYEIVNDGKQPIDPQIDNIIQLIGEKERMKPKKKASNLQDSTKQTNKTTMQQTVLSIAGKPGLYKLISRGKQNLIVETLDATHKRLPAFATDRITSLADIAMFTDADDVPLMTVLAAIRDKEQAAQCSLNPKKCSSAELHDYFAQVLPNYDRDRVHDSDIRKLLSWYNILVSANITDFEEEMKPTEGDNIDDRKDAE
ncbi:MAG: dephospho-CoA kinase [Prevotella sp.]|nr:dephospho-CoA kinase [Prevotella sp.]